MQGQPLENAENSAKFLLVRVEKNMRMRVNEAWHHNLPSKVDIAFGHRSTEEVCWSLRYVYDQAGLGVNSDRDIIHKGLLLRVEQRRGVNRVMCCHGRCVA